MHYFIQSKAKLFSKAQFTKVNEQFENSFNTAIEPAHKLIKRIQVNELRPQLVKRICKNRSLINRFIGFF
jgi:arsenate reductase-like glutaredoxin family protein